MSSLSILSQTKTHLVFYVFSKLIENFMGLKFKEKKGLNQVLPNKTILTLFLGPFFEFLSVLEKTMGNYEKISTSKKRR